VKRLFGVARPACRFSFQSNSRGHGFSPHKCMMKSLNDMISFMPSFFPRCNSLN